MRLSPVKSDVVRISFCRDGEPKQTVHNKIKAKETEKTWMYREDGNLVELLTDDLCLRVDKQTGAVIYRNRNKDILLEERGSECRQIASAGSGKYWMFFDWKKKEQLYAPGTKNGNCLKLNGSARYIQPDTSENVLPLVISDKGYSIMIATDNPVIFCNIPAYGSYLSAEGETQMDFYFSLMSSSKPILIS